MKYIYLFTLLALFSCNDNKVSASKTSNQKPVADTAVSKEADYMPEEVNVFSAIRPDERLNKGEINVDQAEYVEYDDNGDYNLFTIKKDKEIVSLHTNFEGASKFLRGDIVEITWKMDIAYIAGEGEKPEYTEWLVSAKKIKDGSVSLFRKKYTKPIKYNWPADQEYTTEFKDYLYTLVEYYLANSTKDLVKANLKNPDTNLVYSIEDGEKNGRSYTILGISNEFENHTSIIQWLYFDNENHKLYEYDLANEKLVEFN
ncbi:MAG: hypothetical protein EOO44_07310 [Flavobacterium sp.]|nr:MAG: hypothetical protein EOO44_07310 [Flavobacterium sp.]